MPGHLLMVSVGPVQEFIAAARRTRDLWFGSHLLSEVSKAVARAVRVPGVKLIFPSHDADLTPENKLNVANVILAEVIDGSPEALAEDAKKAAEGAWEQFAAQAAAFENADRVINWDMWNEQVDGVIEVYAAWVPIGDDYAAARKRVGRLLAGRKHCRDFDQALPHPGVPKSSLDGLRETVLRRPERPGEEAEFRKSWGSVTRGRLRVRAGEQLDVVGVVKRVWQQDGEKATYPSVSRIAADPWVRGVTGRPGGPALLDALAKAARRIPGVKEFDRKARWYEQYKAYPLEGTTLFRSRLPELWEETDVPDRLKDELSRALAAAEKMAGEPNPYLAVLVADGDNMGKTLAALKTSDEHRGFSRELATFAADAGDVVTEHHGVLVFSGGDDVLAFLPVDQVLPCARKLHDAFGDIMTRALVGKDVPKPTLSVGVAVGHFLEDLEDLLGYGRAAEKDAKAADGKDALAVHLHKRGGSPVTVRAPWGEKPDDRLTNFAGWLNGGALPNKVAADFHNVARVYDEWTGPAVAIRNDVLRVLAAKKPRDTSRLGDVREMIHARVTDADSLRRLADELLVARQVAAGLRRANPEGVRA